MVNCKEIVRKAKSIHCLQCLCNIFACTIFERRKLAKRNACVCPCISCIVHHKLNVEQTLILWLTGKGYLLCVTHLCTGKWRRIRMLHWTGLDFVCIKKISWTYLPFGNFNFPRTVGIGWIFAEVVHGRRTNLSAEISYFLRFSWRTSQACPSAI